MEKYRKSLKTRLYIDITICLIVILAMVFRDHIFNNITSTSHQNGFRSGMGSGLLVAMSVDILNIVTSLRNKVKFREDYIKDNDEREQMIQYKSMKITLIIEAYTLGTAVFISSFFDLLITQTLYMMGFFIVFIKLVSMWYYRKKL